MNTNILIHYPKSTSTPINVNYKVSNNGNVKTITCSLPDKGNIPNWLELQNFELTALKIDQEYNLLFEQRKFDRNLETVLFIDKVFEKIMDVRKAM